MNNSEVSALSQAELLAFVLPALPMAVIGLVGNALIIFSYVRFKTLRAVGSVHMMALLALYDFIYSISSM